MPPGGNTTVRATDSPGDVNGRAKLGHHKESGSIHQKARHHGEILSAEVCQRENLANPALAPSAFVLCIHRDTLAG